MKRRVLLVSDPHHFSTADIYKGYCEAFSKMKIDYEVVNTAELVRYYSQENAWGLVFAKLMNVECEFSHVLFISGLLVPDWLLKSISDNIKVGIIASDDPHAGKILLKKKEWIDYYFTNCKKMVDEKNKIFYLPTATSFNLPTLPKSEVPIQYHSNVVFVGTVYDDRVNPLEDIAEYCEKNKLTLKIVGPLLNTPENSIIRKYAEEKIISNDETKLLYRASDCAINLDRNIHWSAFEKNGNRALFDVGEPYSANPRVYEIAGCRTAQLFVNARPEVKDVFGDNVFYCTEHTIEEGMDQIFKSNQDELLVKINNCFNIVVNGHTYYHRACSLFDYIKKEEETNG